jgi:hypothetical protein
VTLLRGAALAAAPLVEPGAPACLLDARDRTGLSSSAVNPASRVALAWLVEITLHIARNASPRGGGT